LTEKWRFGKIGKRQCDYVNLLGVNTMATLYFLLFLAFFIPFFLLLMGAWFKDERPSPGLFLLLLPALLFLIVTIREVMLIW